MKSNRIEHWTSNRIELLRALRSFPRMLLQLSIFFSNSNSFEHRGSEKLSVLMVWMAHAFQNALLTFRSVLCFFLQEVTWNPDRFGQKLAKDTSSRVSRVASLTAIFDSLFSSLIGVAFLLFNVHSVRYVALLISCLMLSRLYDSMLTSQRSARRGSSMTEDVRVQEQDANSANGS